jgi:transcriptional regulator with XRE-family HTH domain
MEAQAKKKAAKALVEARKLAGLTQADAAAAVGMTAQQLSRYEKSGIRHLDALERLAQAWGDKAEIVIRFTGGEMKVEVVEKVEAAEV